ncbi:DHHA1 domain-containing protein [Robertmurraya korlensis]|uniref:alanyl-tRNA editing protein n=1 Tax=Robertmurraya korlensis TaxID=519977 RepID=UPI0020421769|nr:DHHA1 domain-containing protein [Robertmurraya korlensis]MCM3601513.1 DHHA1 domain-containing protein [Robertmurraya korlensis]
MTNKLYYENVYQSIFVATVTKSEDDYIVLSETAFYPTGGGQPCDTGTINGILVSNVEEVDGEIRHYMNDYISVGSKVEGIIDWEKRFDHMQQHAGQHILTAAFEELYGYETISFHLGSEKITIDLNVENISSTELEKVEQLANQIILEQRKIETKWVSKEEVNQYPLRKILSVEENIRLVIIPEFDYNGCGGTHPQNTGEVQAITILGTERQKKKTRVEFVCGQRVRKQIHNKTNVVSKLTSLLHAPQNELETAALRLIDRNKTLEKEIKILKDNILQFEAQDLLKDAIKVADHRVVQASFADKSLQELQTIARNVLAFDSEVNVLFVSEINGKLQFLCQREKSIINMKNLAQSILPVINGRGGGNEKQAQGGGESKTITSEALLTMLLHQLK